MTKASAPYIREVQVSEELSNKLENLAWETRQSKSALLGAIVERFVESGLDGVENLEEPDTRGSKSKRARFLASDELWQKADDKAWEHRTSRMNAIRLIAYEMTKNISAEKPTPIR